MSEENLCLKCEVRGLCCINQEKIGNILRYARCNYLDENNWCTIYEKRHEINPYCLTVEEMLEEGLDPEGCLYGTYKDK